MALVSGYGRLNQPHWHLAPLVATIELARDSKHSSAFRRGNDVPGEKGWTAATPPGAGSRRPADR
jgi:hypothetical protein